MEVLGKEMCEETKEEIIKYACNYERGDQHPRIEIFDYDISMKDMKTVMKFEKERDP